MEMRNKYALILTAAGSSTRLGTGIKKEYLPMDGGTVLSSACFPFIDTLKENLSFIVITHPENKRPDTEEALFKDSRIKPLLEEYGIELMFTGGGGTRQESVRNAMETLAADAKVQPDIVMIHDAARPWVTPDIIEDGCRTAAEHGAAVPAVKATDTLAAGTPEETISGYIDRNTTWCLQTPQCFNFSRLLDAHRKAAAEKRTDCTDDTTVWAAYCSPVHLSKGSWANKKITFAADIPGGNRMTIRTGLGYDLHRLKERRPLMLGGVEIPSDKGEDGHSDGDVLLHAITDALLGAAGLSDIGELFPPSDDRWKGADSKMLLATAWQKVRAEGWKLENLDCVIALEKPKFLPFRTQVRESIASVLECSPDQIFVKAKTGEKLGEIGRSEAVEVWASCLLSR